MPRLLLILISLPLITGCSPAPEPSHPPIEDPLFCDVMQERFRYTQVEIDTRQAMGWTANLAREYALNLSWDRECSTGDRSD